MSISVDVYTEAKIDGVWTNIDYWVHYPPGRPVPENGANEHIVPCLIGGSSVNNILRHLDVCTSIQYQELSDTLKGQYFTMTGYRKHYPGEQEVLEEASE